jgi:GH35 family endo-1,4-beta-xylanase
MVSRRDFLKIAGLGAGATLLNGCTPKAIPPTVVSSTTASPTATLAPTRALTPTAALDFHALLSAEVAQYAQAYGFGETEVASRVIQVKLSDKMGRPFSAAIDSQTSIPLLVTDEQAGWQPAYLKEIAKYEGIHVGNILGSGNPAQDLKRDFNYGVLGSRWDDIQANGPNSFIYDGVDIEYKAAPFAGIHDVWYLALIVGARRGVPKWLKALIDSRSITKDELMQYMKTYIQKTIDHFKDRVMEFVVVSEPVWDDPFWKSIGPEYIDEVFQLTRDYLYQVGSTALLTFEWYDNHWSGGVWTGQTRQIVERLAGKGLIDRVGMEMQIGHTDPRLLFDRADVTNTIKSFGVRGEITEFIVQINKLSGTQQERFIKQAEVYENLLSAALSAGVRDITFWGVNDKEWYESNVKWDPQYAIPSAQPCLFDDNDQPKPAYYAARKVLLETSSTPVT